MFFCESSVIAYTVSCFQAQGKIQEGQIKRKKTVPVFQSTDHNWQGPLSVWQCADPTHCAALKFEKTKQKKSQDCEGWK